MRPELSRLQIPFLEAAELANKGDHASAVRALFSAREALTAAGATPRAEGVAELLPIVSSSLGLPMSAAYLILSADCGDLERALPSFPNESAFRGAWALARERTVKVPGQAPAKVRISWSETPTDDRFVEKLRTHLTSRTWSRALELISSKDGADFVLVLLSAAYLARKVSEIHEICDQERQGCLRVIPVLASACSIKGTPFEGRQCLPKDRRPAAQHGDRDCERVWDEITVEVVEAVRHGSE